MAQSGGQRARAFAMGVVRADREQIHGRQQPARARVVSGQWQSWLFPGQSCPLGDGRYDSCPMRRRHLSSSQRGRDLMAWAGFPLLVLVGVGIVCTGLPAAVVLMMVATLG